MPIKKTFSTLISYLLEILFPASHIVHELEHMSPEEIRNTLPHSNYVVDKTFTVFCYKSEYCRTLIHHIKYHGNMRLAEKISNILEEELTEHLSELMLYGNFVNPLLIPIPISRQKRALRGFNQTEIIGRKISKTLDLEYCEKILKKTRETPSQARTHSKTERLANLCGCFEVTHPDAIKNRNILLFDDVITTGATTAEAAKTLKKAGAKKIIRVAIAH